MSSLDPLAEEFEFDGGANMEETDEVEVDADENDVRVTAQGRLKSYVAYVLNMFASVEKPTDDVILRGIGRAINKVVTLAEIIKRQVPGLHQVTSIGSSEITDVFPPTEDGAEAVTRVRRVSSVTIRLSKVELDDMDPGYQAPAPLLDGQIGDPTEAAAAAAALFAAAEAARPAATPLSGALAVAAGLDLVPDTLFSPNGASGSGASTNNASSNRRARGARGQHAKSAAQSGTGEDGSATDANPSENPSSSASSSSSGKKHHARGGRAPAGGPSSYAPPHMHGQAYGAPAMYGNFMPYYGAQPYVMGMHPAQSLRGGGGRGGRGNRGGRGGAFAMPQMGMTPEQAAAAHQYMMQMSPTAFQQWQAQYQQYQQQHAQYQQQFMMPQSSMVGGAVAFQPSATVSGVSSLIPTPVASSNGDASKSQ